MTDDLYPVIPKAKRRPLGWRWGRKPADGDAFEEIQNRPEPTPPTTGLTTEEHATLGAALSNFWHSDDGDFPEAEHHVHVVVEDIIAARETADRVGRW